MNKCLIVKHSGVSPNEELPKVGELCIRQSKVESPTSKTQILITENIVDYTIRVSGDAYITDESLTENLGKSVNLKANIRNTIYISNADCLIYVSNKYKLSTIHFDSKTGSFVSNNKEIDLSELKYSNNLISLHLNTIGSISNLQNTSLIFLLELKGEQITGDISNINKNSNLTYFSSLNTNVTGDIASLKDLVNLRGVSVGPNVTGDIASLKNLVKLMNINATNVTGDIASLKDLVNLRGIMGPNITGDIATTPDSFSYFWTGNQKLSWSERRNSANIISIAGRSSIDNVDKMLQDQSKCVVVSDVSLKAIMCVGTRTSASDEAVATLQSKGYTVSITPA